MKPWFIPLIAINIELASTWNLSTHDSEWSTQPLAYAALHFEEEQRGDNRNLRVFLFGGPRRDSQRRVAKELVADHQDKGSDVLRFDTAAQHGQKGSTPFELRFATVIRDHLVENSRIQQSHKRPLVIVLSGAELMPAVGLEMVLRPLQAAAEVSVGPHGDVARNGHPAAAAAGQILGTEVTFPPATTVVLLFHLQGLALDAAGGPGDLAAAQESLRSSVPPALKRVLFRHGSVALVPFVEPAPFWEAKALACLRARHPLRGNRNPQVDAKGGSGSGGSGNIGGGSGGVTVELSRMFSGQRHAVSAVARALAARTDGEFAVDGADGSPLVLALVGPSGTGKTEFARQVVLYVVRWTWGGVAEQFSTHEPCKHVFFLHRFVCLLLFAKLTLHPEYSLTTQFTHFATKMTPFFVSHTRGSLTHTGG
jgi:hypothetical protein